MKYSHASGLTLVDVLILIFILGIIVALAGPLLVDYFEQTRSAPAETKTGKAPVDRSPPGSDAATAPPSAN